MSSEENKLTGPYIGSHWIVVNAAGKAACPHCEKLSWNSGKQWGGGCKHVIGPGSVKDQNAMIFRGTA